MGKRGTVKVENDRYRIDGEFHVIYPNSPIFREDNKLCGVTNPRDMTYIHSYGGESPFFAGIAEGKLMGTRCDNEKCEDGYKSINVPFRIHCPDCLEKATAIDMTDVKRSEERLAHQAEMILELSTPVIQIWDGVIVAPLIGTLDSQRTQQFMDRFLDMIARNRSEVAMVDITGVPVIDTQTAQHLIEAVTAARLLGAHVVLTGVRPAIAQTLVHLGIELGDIATRSSLMAGFRYALDYLGLDVTTKSETGGGEI